ncbi:hypothetical protein HGM15179_018474 [Zosterops borbonicus]|uniref:Uncharacterized protein n=1 Tax=Zosterops borbonicus TaxID=364589 RepID=A0A8K1FYY5_9PASS|nr:hypothetical protein HGM15179_018474 [Zosterops borbonicus]
MVEMQTKVRPDLGEEELEEGEKWFVDGSARVIEGKRKSGYAIVDGLSGEVVESGPLAVVRLSNGCSFGQPCRHYIQGATLPEAWANPTTVRMVRRIERRDSQDVQQGGACSPRQRSERDADLGMARLFIEWVTGVGLRGTNHDLLPTYNEGMHNFCTNNK